MKTPFIADGPFSPFTPGQSQTEIWGEVHAHNQVMSYRHRGGGPLVVLLGEESSADLWPELPVLLSRDFRVVLPQLPVTADVANWLACFLDGLGASDVAVIAGGHYCFPAVELALGLGGGEAVSRLVLVGDGNLTAEEEREEAFLEAGTRDTGDEREGKLSTVSAALPVPLLVLRRRLRVAEAHTLATEFLRGVVAPSARAPSR